MIPARATMISCGLVLATLLSACATGDPVTQERSAPSGQAAQPGREATLQAGSRFVEMCLLVADTPAERAEGLSRRDDLGGYDGMLFVFERAKRWSFWMQDTRIPLELVAVDSEGALADPIQMEPCPPGTDCPYYTPDIDYDRALEFAAGYLGDLAMGPGGSVKFELGESGCARTAAARSAAAATA